MMKVTNPATIEVQTPDGLVTVPNMAVIKTRVDYEDFELKPGESADTFDFRAFRLIEIYPWLVLEETKVVVKMTDAPDKAEVKDMAKKVSKRAKSIFIALDSFGELFLH